MTKKAWPVLAGLMVSCLLIGAREIRSTDLKRFTTLEIEWDSRSREEAYLARPVCITYDEEHIYIVDAEECAIKVFSKSGELRASLGRKGQGPAEFSFPSGLSVRDGRMYVADKFNYRIQVLDLSGTYQGGFKVPFAPDKIFILAENEILVTHNPLNRRRGEKMLHAFDKKGDLLWEELEAHFSGDPIYDSFRNMISVNAGPDMDFFVIHKSQERSIGHFESSGRHLRRILIDEAIALKPITLPFKSGKKEIRGLCWSSAVDQQRFYLLTCEYTKEGDLGPGRELYVLDEGGRLGGIVVLPDKMIRVAVDGDAIYAIDEERELRILKVVPR